MNEMSIKPSPIVDSASGSSGSPGKSDKAAALAALASSFQDLVNKIGTNVDGGLSSIAERQGISAVSDSREPSPQYSDDQSGQSDDRGERQVARGRDDTRNGGRDEQAGNDRGQDDYRGPEAAPREERTDNRQDQAVTSQDDDSFDTVSPVEKPGGAGQRDGDTAANGQDTAQDAGRQNADNGQNGGAGNGNGQAGGGPKSTDVATAMAEAVAAGDALNAAQLVIQSGGPAIADDGMATDAAGLNAASGLATAAAAATKTDGANGAAGGRQQTAANPGQVQAGNTGQGQNQAETATKGQSNAQQQAQQISRSLGEEMRMQINVNVTDEAETLTSRPLTTLAGNAAVSADGRVQAQGSQQANTHGAPAQNPNAVAAANQAQGGQAQGQNAGANNGANQPQLAAQTGGSANGPSTASTTAQAGTGATATAGGEGSSSTANLSASGQSQQAQQGQQAQQAAQTAQARGPNAGPTPAEQVSVRITRALQAGNDRISIRLNPAELGRVEVKVELAQDGRVTAVVTADNRDTLDILRRDASDLQKALQDGGLDLDSGDLAFNLRGEEGEQTADGGDANPCAPEAVEEPDIAEVDPELILSPEDVVLGEGRIDVKA